MKNENKEAREFLPIKLVKRAGKFKPLPIPRECDYPHCYEKATASHQVAGITLYLCKKHDVGTIDSKILVEIKQRKEEKKKLERRNQNRT